MISRRSRLQGTDLGSPAQWGLGKICTPAQHGFKQGPQLLVLHRWGTLMVLPASRETKAGLGRGKVPQDTLRFSGNGGQCDGSQYRSRT